MFRRIEIIQHTEPGAYERLIQAIHQDTGEPEEEIRLQVPRECKMGLLGTTASPASDPWIEMNSPRRAVNRKCRFYFTEEGWRRYGRSTIAACQRIGQEYRVLAIKEKSVDVIYRDEFQVAVRPKRKRRA